MSKIALHRYPDTKPVDTDTSYDPILDNITSVLADVCDGLEASRAVRFEVEGFGFREWRVDVATDLAVLIEQVPAALRTLRRLQPAALNFYEQGVERKLSLVPVDDQRATITSAGARESGSVEEVSIADFVAMLERLLTDFVQAAEAVCPQLAAHAWFRTWSTV